MVLDTDFVVFLSHFAAMGFLFFSFRDWGSLFGVCNLWCIRYGQVYHFNVRVVLVEQLERIEVDRNKSKLGYLDGPLCFTSAMYLCLSRTACNCSLA